MKTINQSAQENEQHISNMAIRTFLCLAAIVYATAFWHAFHTQTYFLVKLLTVEVALASIAIFLAMRLFKH